MRGLVEERVPARKHDAVFPAALGSITALTAHRSGVLLLSVGCRTSKSGSLSSGWRCWDLKPVLVIDVIPTVSRIPCVIIFLVYEISANVIALLGCWIIWRSFRLCCARINMANQSRRLVFRNFGSARRRECSRDLVAKAALAGRWMATSAFERNFSRRNAAAFCGTIRKLIEI